MKNRGTLIVLSGFSGVGKNTVMNRLLELYPDEFIKSVSVTTREKREDEVDGESYFFKTKKEFDNMLLNNEFLEWTTYAGNNYGTPRDFIEKSINSGKTVLMILNTVGAKYIKRNYNNSSIVFIGLNSVDEVLERLRLRGTETDNDIEKRISEMKEEVKDIQCFDYYVVNDDLDKCVRHLYNIINSSKSSVRSNIDLVNLLSDKLEDVRGRY